MKKPTLQHLLATAVTKGASDLHLFPGEPPFLRINGNLGPIKDMPVSTPMDNKELIYSGMTPEQQKSFEQERVLETSVNLPQIGNFRLSALHQMRGVAAIYRIIPEVVPTFDQLGLPDVFKRLLGLTQGLILVAGPTGSGKTTTLAAMIEYINTYQASNIITIEDPIEFIHTNKKSIFHQIQVGRDTPDFSNALRASLRQDPDVILLGELRDLETMRLALTAAETGHLVLATIHASSAPLAINRFADVFPTEEKNRVRTLLSETLQAVICQTLVKKISGGRVAALEIMLASAPIRHFIRQDMPAHMESTLQTSGDRGMCSLEQHLNLLVKRNIISPVIANSVIANRNVFREAREPLKKAKKT